MDLSLVIFGWKNQTELFATQSRFWNWRYRINLDCSALDGTGRSIKLSAVHETCIIEILMIVSA
jgi:hypothetical protein